MILINLLPLLGYDQVSQGDSLDLSELQYPPRKNNGNNTVV